MEKDKTILELREQHLRYRQLNQKGIGEGHQRQEQQKQLEETIKDLQRRVDDNNVVTLESDA